MIKIPRSTYENNSSAAKYIKENSINLCRGAKIIFVPWPATMLWVTTAALIAVKSESTPYGMLFVCCRFVGGRYCTIASRVSIGAFSHPLDCYLSMNFNTETRQKYMAKHYLKEANVLRRDELETALGHDVWIGDNVHPQGRENWAWEQ